jgi:glycosyltransferase involved in cell wall biosynthesis
LFSTSFYPRYHLGGDATHVKYLAEELTKKGHEVHVLHSIDAYKIKRKNMPLLKKETKKDNLFIHSIESKIPSFDPGLAYYLGRSFNVEKIFSQLLKTVKPDVVHHHNVSLLGYSVLEKKGNYSSLYTAHDYWLFCQTNNLMRKNGQTCFQKQCYSCVLARKRFPQFWRDSKSFSKAISDIDLLISPSDYLRERLFKELNLESVTIPNFVPSVSCVTGDPGFTDYFLFVGMLERHKGILNLLAVFKELKKDCKATLVIVGGGSLENYIKRYIAENCLSNVFFLGFVDQQKLYSLYSNALALIVPSIWPENAPLVTLEALSVGTPVIGSNSGGLPEIITKFSDKLVFSDVVALKKILINFSKNDFQKNTIRQIYDKNFSAQAYVDNYIGHIKNLLNKGV